MDYLEYFDYTSREELEKEWNESEQFIGLVRNFGPECFPALLLTLYKHVKDIDEDDMEKLKEKMIKFDSWYESTECDFDELLRKTWDLNFWFDKILNKP
tara:strand:+ start:86 stop:382 length:297 start_codon:yes stop_codon:yes gene_type:complete